MHAFLFPFQLPPALRCALPRPVERLGMPKLAQPGGGLQRVAQGRAQSPSLLRPARVQIEDLSPSSEVATARQSASTRTLEGSGQRVSMSATATKA
jgi:hypothetical protein